MGCDPAVASVALEACGPTAMAPVAFSAAGLAVLAFAVNWGPTAGLFQPAAPWAQRLGISLRSLVVASAATGLLAFLAGYYAALDLSELVGFAIIGAAIAQVFIWTPTTAPLHAF